MWQLINSSHQPVRWVLLFSITEEALEAQRGEVLCPGSPSQCVRKRESREFDSERHTRMLGAKDMQFKKAWSSCCGSAVMNPTSVHEDVGLIPGLAQWLKDLAWP